MLLLNLTCFDLHHGRRCSPGSRCSFAETGVEVLASASIVELFACQLVSCCVCSRQSLLHSPDSCVEKGCLHRSTQAAAHLSSNSEASATTPSLSSQSGELASADAMQLREKVSALHVVQKLWLDLP